MSKKVRRSLSGTEKLSILREHLVEGKPVSSVCEVHGVQPSLFYYWQRQLFENGATVFGGVSKVVATRERQQAETIERLEAKLARKDHVIAELSEDLVHLKKDLGEL